MSEIKPTRAQSQPRGVSVDIADLDAILGGPVRFKLHGNSHEILPVSAMAYLQFINNVNEFQALNMREDLTIEEATEKTLDVFKPLIPSLTKDDLLRCTQPQIAALFSLVIERVQGKVGTSDKKKLKH